MKEPLEELVRRVDQDRWLSSRFASAPVRKHLTALYAFNYEVAHVGESSSQEAVGAIRLKWWSDAIAALHEGAPPPAHPAMAPLADAVAAAQLPRAPFDALIQARTLDLEPVPFETWADLEDYLDATAGGLITLAAKLCAPSLALDPALANLLRASGRAWGYIGLVRALPYWTSQRRTFFPKRLREHVGLDENALFSGAALDHATESAVRGMLDRASGALRDVERLAPSAPKEIFPAIGYVTLTRGYIRAAQTGGDRRVAPMRTSLIARQLKLVGAAATGSL